MSRIAVLAALTGLYIVAGRFGLSLAFVNEHATAIWPPTGIAVAACLLGGISLWPAVFVGAFVVNLATNHAPVPSLLIACGNSAEAVVTALLIKRGAGGFAFDRTSRILFYVGAAVAGARASSNGNAS